MNSVPASCSCLLPPVFGAQGRTQTFNLWFVGPALHRLSYSGKRLVIGVGIEPTFRAFQTRANPSQLSDHDLERAVRLELTNTGFAVQRLSHLATRANACYLDIALWFATWIQSEPPRGSGWVRSLRSKRFDFVPTRYREVVLTVSNKESLNDETKIL